jgi:hypothetical protein
VVKFRNQLKKKPIKLAIILQSIKKIWLLQQNN